LGRRRSAGGRNRKRSDSAEDATTAARPDRGDEHQAAIQDRGCRGRPFTAIGNAALQALLLDPVVTSYRDAERMLDELLAAHADVLPQFNGKK